MNLSKYILGVMSMAIISLPLAAHAQDYEDDIYYNPSKQVKKKVKTVQSNATYDNNNYYGGITYKSVPDYPAADSYTFSTGSTRDVDEYNRHDSSAGMSVADTDSMALMTNDFEYTRRIERFHNADVVVSSNDGDVIDYYYNTPSNSCVTNIYVNTDPLWNWTWNYGWSSWYSPYYYPSWRWSWSYYNPWYWGPSYSWGWGYDPWYWNGYYPGYYPSVRPPYWGGGHAWHHSTSHGSSHPHPSTGSFGNNRRPGTVAGGSSSTGIGSTISRPGNMGRGRYNYNGSTSHPSTDSFSRQGISSRPGASNSSSTTTRPGVSSSSSSTSRPGNMGRGRDNYNSSSTRPSTTRPSNSSYRSSGSNYNSSRSSGSFGGRSSGGSYGGGRSSGGRTGGFGGRR